MVGFVDLHTYERTNQCDMLQFGILPAWQLFETLTIVILLVYNCNFERKESY